MTNAYAQSTVANDRNSVEIFQFSSIKNQQRAYYLARHLRCPKCQNQNLMESNASIAVDMKYRVFVMVEQGKTDTEVMDFMQQRFGEFVLYKPKLEHKTWLLWFTPIVLLLLLVWVASRLVLKRQPKKD
ncbi:cytochrome c-type biogenesis protein [Vibrio algivorus]|uniref:Cytochrome c-type biogenesis protein n=1 Tax=Vibrio algivorus TaxID=1667024 RepID=A0ABQ6ENC9_9VIBR|nr:cytochrome c-type biogenesis protein [Vibrio algivorus]GLT14638.1 hypothetical protein GCM10007931_16130 [Vibrio algivorus]